MEIKKKENMNEDLTDEEIVNWRIKNITNKIKERSKNKNDQKMDPYFDSIKNWLHE